MNITKAKYIKNTPGNTNTVVQATIDGKEWSVPMNEDNRFYQAILKWVAAGNTIEEAD
jgi:hypothetical protein